MKAWVCAIIPSLVLAGCAAPPADAPQVPERHFPVPPGSWTTVASLPVSYAIQVTKWDGGVATLQEARSIGGPAEGVYLWSGTGDSFRVAIKEDFKGFTLGIVGVGREILIFRWDDQGLRVDHYNPETGTISTDPRLPELVSSISVNERPDVSRGASTLHSGNTIYFIGGCCKKAAIWTYSLDTKRFTRLSDVPYANNFIDGPRVALDGEQLLLHGSSGFLMNEVATFKDGEWHHLGKFDRSYGVPIPRPEGIWDFMGDCVRLIARDGTVIGSDWGRYQIGDSYPAQVVNAIQFRDRILVFLDDAKPDYAGRMMEWDPPPATDITGKTCPSDVGTHA